MLTTCSMYVLVNLNVNQSKFWLSMGGLTTQSLGMKCICTTENTEERTIILSKLKLRDLCIVSFLVLQGFIQINVFSCSVNGLCPSYPAYNSECVNHGTVSEYTQGLHTVFTGAMGNEGVANLLFLINKPPFTRPQGGLGTLHGLPWDRSKWQQVLRFYWKTWQICSTFEFRYHFWSISYTNIPVLN